MSPEAREYSFDDLARGLADGSVTRGKALRLMGAALVGGALGSLGIREAAADQCKRNGKACKKDKQCCSGNCSSGTCAAACVSVGGACTADDECCSGACFIPGGGFCVPPAGSNLVECACMDDSFLNICSAACGSDAHQVCVAFCAPHGGLEAEQCAPNPGCGAS
jgi:hypothetical protein